EHLSRVAKAKLDLAHQELERLEKDREFKVSRAERKLRSMKDQAERYMVAPVEGTVIETLQNPGEVSSGGLVIKLADLRRMNVLAEVFEGEITRVKPGMQAVITAKVFSEPLNGKVVSVGRIISPQSRNVQVAISLDNPEIASGYINLEVNVSILP
ncbi:MAG: efflux RND transporter periplasmic adaptor subunit, partial [Syntrophobacteraceae bacterium]